MGNGKRGIAPCGHPGEYVTNTFIACDQRCEFEDDAIPVEVTTESTPKLAFSERCPACGSYDIEPYTIYYFGNYTGKHCLPCGKVWS